jgi:hypothetical protein
MGQLNEGVYATDPMDDVHPDTIERYYGVEGAERVQRPGQTGAGHEEDDDWIDKTEPLVNAVTDDLAHNIRHPAIKVACHRKPFRSPEIEQNFLAALGDIIAQGIVPEGYGVLENEWDGPYPALEAINPGTRGKQILVALPRDLWLPRAILFAQGLDAMTRSLVFEEAELGDAYCYDSESSSSSQEDID